MRHALKYLALGLLISCGAATTGDPLADAWQKFVDQDYAGAHQGFEDLVFTQGADAYAGLGWVSIKMDSIPEADVYFGLSIAFGDSVNQTSVYAAAMAGWSFVGWQRGNYGASIGRAGFVLRTVPNFIFQYDNNATKNGLILAQANDYFHLGDATNCIERIQQLETFNHTAAEPDITATLLTELDALDAALRL